MRFLKRKDKDVCRITSIGPLIVEPHSTSYRVDLETTDDIGKCCGNCPIGWENRF